MKIEEKMKAEEEEKEKHSVELIKKYIYTIHKVTRFGI